MSALRDALAAVALPAVNDGGLQETLAAAEDAAFDLAHALHVAAKANDPHSVQEAAVEAIVALESAAAAAKALEGRFEALKKAAKEASAALRGALAAEMRTTGRKRVEGSSHAATPEAGSLRVVVEDEGALPGGMTRTSVKPDLSLIGRTLAAGQAVPGARRERGPDSVRITLLAKTAAQPAVEAETA